MIQSVADEMETSEPLNGQYFSFLDQRSGFADSSFYFSSCFGIGQVDLWTANRTGDGLGMISPVQGIDVLIPAVCAHGEAFHGCLFSVVRKGFDDRVARSAVCAVDERIMMSPVSGVHHFFIAVFADGNVGRDEHKAFSLFRFFDREVFETEECGRFQNNLLDLRQRGSSFLERIQEIFEIRFYLAFEMDFDSETDVLDPTCAVKSMGQSIDKRPEPDSLDDSKNDDPHRPFFIHVCV